MAQGLSVTGQVTDAATNDPLPSVTVQLKGTTTGATTNVDGTYTISVPAGNATLVFSYVGYTVKEISINNRTIMNVALKVDAKTLEQVLVVGYGTQPKADVPVAVDSIVGEDIAESGTVNPFSRVPLF